MQRHVNYEFHSRMVCVCVVKFYDPRHWFVIVVRQNGMHVHFCVWHQCDFFFVVVVFFKIQKSFENWSKCHKKCPRVLCIHPTSCKVLLFCPWERNCSFIYWSFHPYWSLHSDMFRGSNLIVFGAAMSGCEFQKLFSQFYANFYGKMLLFSQITNLAVVHKAQFKNFGAFEKII